MMELIVVPYNWPCMLQDCPNGLVLIGGSLCVKTTDGEIFAETGEACWDGKKDHPERAGATVQAAKIIWRKMPLPREEREVNYGENVQ